MNIFDFTAFYRQIDNSPLSPFKDQLREAIEEKAALPNGNLPAWQNVLNSLPELSPLSLGSDGQAVCIKTQSPKIAENGDRLKNLLMQLSPWRKGPFRINDIFIDSEWRSDLKWRRLADRIADLKGKTILDIGCGNGYYMLRMVEHNPGIVIGVDPSLLFLCQFHAIKKYTKNLPVFMLPLGIEDLPQNMQVFDSIFSMGVFYHRRSPFDFLKSLRIMLKPGGELILETLITEGDENHVLVPEGRYARMNNVWFLPSAPAMQKWLIKSGFKNIQLADTCRTTISEQRKTEWMQSESFEMCLNQENELLTIEGHPAPVRAVFTCNR